MNRYIELKQRQQEEFSAFPMEFAFCKEQFIEGMKKLGLKPTDTHRIYKIPGGGFYRREDSQRLKEMFERFDQELQAAIADDKTGDGFIYEMFLHELDCHEYSCTRELDETLAALGFTLEDIQTDKRLVYGLEKARREILED